VIKIFDPASKLYSQTDWCSWQRL